MAYKIHGFFYCLSALILILSSTTTIILTSFNLNDLLLLPNRSAIQRASFKYNGAIGASQPFCMDNGFLTFGWLCGFLTIPSLFTGLMAYGVKRSLSRFASFFLVWSAFSSFVSSIITAIVTSLVLFCHVTLTGLMPSGTLFIAIFSAVQMLCGMICFFVVCCRRTEEAMDLKYGIEPLPDPWQLTSSQRVLLESKPNFIDGGEFPFYGHVTPLYEGHYGPNVVLTENKEEPPAEKRVVLNNPGVKTANQMAPNNTRQQLFPAQTSMIRPFPIDRVSSPPNVYKQHELPFNCIPMN